MCKHTQLILNIHITTLYQTADDGEFLMDIALGEPKESRAFLSSTQINFCSTQDNIRACNKNTKQLINFFVDIRYVIYILLV